MPVNLYERPAGYQHIPFPFEEVLKSGMLMQSQEDKAKQNLVDIANQQYKGHTVDLPQLQGLQNNINQQIESIYQKSKETGLRNTASDIHNLRASIAEQTGQFGKIGAIQTNLKEYQDYNANLDKLHQAGKIDKDTKDYLSKKADALYEQQGGIGEPDQFNRFQHYTTVTPAEYVDTTDRLTKLGSGWKADGMKNGFLKESEDGSLLIHTKTGWEKADKTEIKNGLRQMLLTDDPSVQYLEQQAEVGAYKTGRNAMDIYENNVESILDAVANKLAYSKGEEDQTAQFTPGRLLEQRSANETTSLTGEIAPQKVGPDEFADVNNIPFDDKGAIKVVPNKEYKLGSRSMEGLQSSIGGPEEAFKTTEEAVQEAKAKQDQYKLIVQRLRNTYNLDPDKFPTDQSVVEAYRNAQKDISQRERKFESVDDKPAKKIGEAVARNKIGRNFYLFDPRYTTNEDGKLSTVVETLGITEKDIDEALRKGIGGYTQMGPEAGAYYVEVKDKEGKSTRVAFTPDSEIAYIFEPSHKLFAQHQSLREGYVPVSSTKIIHSKPTFDQNGKVSYEDTAYKITGIDSQGNITGLSLLGKVSLEEMQLEEQARLKKSNYFGLKVAEE